MTRERLQRILEQRGFDPDSYRLFGSHDAEAYVMDRRGKEWVVFYSERGLGSGLKSFENEDLACRYFANLVWQDPTTRVRN
jgi:hypothetical protein